MTNAEFKMLLERQETAKQDLIVHVNGAPQGLRISPSLRESTLLVGGNIWLIPHSHGYGMYIDVTQVACVQISNANNARQDAAIATDEA